MLNLKFTDFVCSHLLASWQEARKLVGAASNGNHDLALSNQYGKGSRHSILRKYFPRIIITKVVPDLENLTLVPFHRSKK